jgi:hypothetical protein
MKDMDTKFQQSRDTQANGMLRVGQFWVLLKQRAGAARRHISNVCNVIIIHVCNVMIINVCTS